VYNYLTTEQLADHRFIAVDKDGEIHGFRTEPKACSNFWAHSDSTDSVYISEVSPDDCKFDWKQMIHEFKEVSDPIQIEIAPTVKARPAIEWLRELEEPYKTEALRICYLPDSIKYKQSEAVMNLPWYLEKFDNPAISFFKLHERLVSEGK